MNEFDYEVKQRKTIARSARNRKGTTYGPRGCRLPCDNMTEAQRRKLNSDVTTYNLSIPMTRGEVRNLPPDIRKEYLMRIVEHGGSASALGRLWGCQPATVLKDAAACGFQFPHTRGSKIKTMAWETWLRKWNLNPDGSLNVITAIDDGSTEELEPEPEVVTSQCDGWDAPVEPSPAMTPASYTLQLSGVFRIADIASALVGMPEIPNPVVVTITVETKGDDEND